ncbi:MAG: glutamate racemase [Brevinematia bacterium]
MDRRPIGIFDSGVGGLTVFKKIREFLPEESIVYLGDTKHLPYGDKSKEAIVRFSIENAKFLLKHDVKAIVIACNSASSVAVEPLREMFKVPIIDVIEPTVECISRSSFNDILVIGTVRTIASGVFASKLSSVSSDVKVFAKACPLFVPLVEEGAFIDKSTYLYRSLQNAIVYYLEEFRGKVNNIILGCTHYPLIKNEILDFMGDVVLIDPGECAVSKLSEVLKNNDLLSDGKYRFEKFFVTDLSERTKQVAKIILGNNILIEEVYISDF